MFIPMLIIFALREAQKGKNLLSDNIIHLVKAENFFSNEKNYVQRIVSSIVNFSPTKSWLKRSDLYFLRRVFCMMNYYYKNNKLFASVLFLIYQCSYFAAYYLFELFLAMLEISSFSWFRQAKITVSLVLLRFTVQNFLGFLSKMRHCTKNEVFH